MNATLRRNILGGGVLLLLALVVADHTGAIDALRAGFAGGSDRADRLIAESSLLSRQRALVDSESAWLDAEAQAERAWQAVRDVVIRADTRSLAEAQLRERVLAAVAGAGIRSTNAIAITRSGPNTTDGPESDASSGPRVERIRFRVGFDAAEHDSAIDAIDRLARLSAPRIRVESLSIAGPGERISAQSQISVTLEIEAVAVIGALRDTPLADRSATRSTQAAFTERRPG